MKKISTVFILIGILYVFIEVAYSSIVSGAMRLVGQSSLWMMLVGGILGVFLDILNEVKWLNKLSYRLKVFIGGTAIVALEFFSGCILNLWLGFDIWDYSKNFCNLLGQTDLLHAIYWYAITPFGFWVGDAIRHYVFEEEKPDKLFNYYKKLITG